MKQTLLLSFLLACLTSVWAQEHVVFQDGKLYGDLSRVEGPEKGMSISHQIERGNLKIAFSGEESWGRVFLESQELVDVATNRYMFLKLRVDTAIILEEIGCGEFVEKGERLRKITLDQQWKSIVMEVPKDIKEFKVPFVLASIQKVTFEFEFIKFVQEIPTFDESTLVLVSAKEERVTGAKYVFGDQIEFGAPSGYSGENNGSSMRIDEHCMENPYRGKYCMKFVIDNSESWRAIFFQAMGKWTPELQGDASLESLKKYKKLVFYARSPQKNYQIPEIVFGGSTNKFSQEPRSIVRVELDNAWRRYEIDIRGLDRDAVNDVMTLTLEPGVFYLDEIRFE